eukprot:TRINITY_DN4378_c0_g2_i1.p1 TRINITY_DN4378_c0_g2~~TRINITY_DN4378_c0_g2_i1.p1  ORF type:complete len:906 (+),score=196.02 TRINITY_DN4378_c0_g2_i1:154-2718(+)
MSSPRLASPRTGTPTFSPSQVPRALLSPGGQTPLRRAHPASPDHSSDSLSLTPNSLAASSTEEAVAARKPRPTPRPAGAGSMKFQVLARIRPLPPGAEGVVQAEGNLILCKDPQTQRMVENKFDRCLDRAATNAQLYEVAGAPTLEAAMQGFNSCVFAYGQTGAGKTHTMLGSGDEKGLSPLLISDLFERTRSAVAEHPERRFEVTVAFMEIYNESIRDLLTDASPQRSASRTFGSPRGGSGTPRPGADQGDARQRRIREHPVRGIFVEGLKEITTTSAEAAVMHMTQGIRERACAPTKMNHRSSRSHAVFQLKIAQTDAKRGLQSHVTTNLVDLAGSENVSKSGVTGDRLEEAINVNQSLSTLRLVLDRLVERQTHPHDTVVIPYRQSVLTRVLQDCLGGNSKTIMIACMSAKDSDLDATRSTLAYATKASQIVCNAKSQERRNKTVIGDLQRQIEELKSQLATAQQCGSPSVPTSPGSPGRGTAADIAAELQCNEQALREAIACESQMRERAETLERSVEQLTKQHDEDQKALLIASVRIEEDQKNLRDALAMLSEAQKELAVKEDEITSPGTAAGRLAAELQHQKDQHKHEMAQLKAELRRAKAESGVQARPSRGYGRQPSNISSSKLARLPSQGVVPRPHPSARRAHTPGSVHRTTRTRKEARTPPPPDTHTFCAREEAPESELILRIPKRRWQMGDRLLYCDRSGNHVEWLLQPGTGRLCVQRVDGAGQSPAIESFRVAESDDPPGVVDVDLLPCGWFSPLPADGAAELLAKLKSLADATGVPHNIGDQLELSTVPEECHGFRVGQRVEVDAESGTVVGAIAAFTESGVEVTFGKLRGTFHQSELRVCT